MSSFFGGSYGVTPFKISYNCRSFVKSYITVQRIIGIIFEIIWRNYVYIKISNNPDRKLEKNKYELWKYTTYVNRQENIQTMKLTCNLLISPWRPFMKSSILVQFKHFLRYSSGVDGRIICCYSDVFPSGKAWGYWMPIY